MHRPFTYEVEHTSTHSLFPLSHVQSITVDDEALRRELENDEGYETAIYTDTEGHKTVGIGHLIVSDDEEHGKSVGHEVTNKRVQELFEQDLGIALESCKDVFSDFGTLPEEAQRVIANMMFNLGKPGFEKFQKFIANVEAGKWNKAADEMVNSKWYTQVKGRSQRLVERMRNLPSEDED